MQEEAGFQRALGPVLLWALGVGYVISGMYFGWNLGLPEGGPHGMLAATALVSAIYVAFVLSYAELACAMPRAGGAFLYANRALGPAWGLVAGAAQCIEFVFAPPAIAAAIGAYLHTLFPAIPPLAIAAVAYLVFTGVNLRGVKASATFELLVTVVAVGELLLFAGVTLPRFSWEAFSREPLPKGWGGAFASIPFAIWFYLAIEGVANTAEEAREPQRDLVRGFGAAMATLVLLAALTFFGAVGVEGWRAVVFPPGSGEPSDSPLPLALSAVVGRGHPLYHLLVGVGLCGLLASFHGILLVAGRATFEFGRVGYAPRWLGRLSSRQTPAAALLCNMAVGLLALVSGRTGEIITVSVYGALTLYVLSMVALLRLRRSEPSLPRPFRAPGYPFTPVFALFGALFCLGAVAWTQPRVGLVYAALIAGALLWFRLGVPREIRERRFEA
jgi:ethanolamine permease